MRKPLTLISILAIGLITIQTHAAEEDEQIRQYCEKEVQAYDITDPEEYRQAVNDCIDSMSPQSPLDQFDSDTVHLDQT